MNTMQKSRLLLCQTLLSLSLAGNSHAAEDNWVYQVTPGDNLWSVSERYLINQTYVQRLQALNRIADPYHIPPGTRLNIPVRWISTSPSMARVENVQGKAELIEAATGKVTALRFGSLVMAGDSVRTGENSSLVLRFVDGSSLSLLANSYLTLQRMTIYDRTGMTDTRLDLHKGRVETQVAPKRGPASQFIIATASAVTSVRGTDYRVSAEPETVISRTEVLQGGVAVSNQGQTREIPKGFGTLTSPDKPPMPPVQLLPAPDLSNLPDNFEQVPLQITLPPLGKQESYRVQIARNAEFKDLVFDQRQFSNTVSGPDLPDGNYFFRARRVDALGLEGKNADKPIVINARPEAPFQVAPKPEAHVTEDKPYLLWTEQKNINRYHIQIARDKAFTQRIIDQIVEDDVKFAPAQELALGDYYWRVASINADDHGPFSDIQQFKRIPPAPELDDTDISDESIIVRARANAPANYHYHFQVAKDESFTQLIADEHVPQPQLTLTPQPAGKYYMRVQSIDPQGIAGPYGQPQILDIPDGGLYHWLWLLPLLALIAI